MAPSAFTGSNIDDLGINVGIFDIRHSKIMTLIHLMMGESSVWVERLVARALQDATLIPTINRKREPLSKLPVFLLLVTVRLCNDKVMGLMRP